MSEFSCNYPPHFMIENTISELQAEIERLRGGYDRGYSDGYKFNLAGKDAEIERLRAELAQCKESGEIATDMCNMNISDNVTLKEENKQLREGLRRLRDEWLEDGFDHDVKCPICQVLIGMDCKPDCWLAALTGEGRE